MNSKLTQLERNYMMRVKQLPCSVCDAPAPSEAHHITQGLHYSVIALCVDCHRDSFLGIHGQKRNWAIYKMDERKALDVTISRVVRAGV